MNIENLRDSRDFSDSQNNLNNQDTPLRCAIFPELSRSKSEKWNKNLKLSDKFISIQAKISPFYSEASILVPPRNWLSDKTIQIIDQILSVHSSPYKTICLKNLGKFTELYYFSVIKQTLYKQKINARSFKGDKKEQFFMKKIRALIQSDHSPLIKSTLTNLKRYYDNQFVLNDDERINLHFIRKLHMTIQAIIEKNTDFFSLPPEISSFEFLIHALSSLKPKLKFALSYIIFGNRNNELNELVLLLEQWKNIPNTKILEQIHSFSSHTTHRLKNSTDYQFNEDTIERSFVPNNAILPKNIFINHLPLNLEQFKGEHQLTFFNFFFTFLKEMKGDYYSLDQLSTIITTFYEHKTLPHDLKNLLGISTISSRLLAFKFLDQIYPDLKSQILLYRYTSKVEIFYNFSSEETACFQPLGLTIYPKLFPNDHDSFAIDESRPLASVSFNWISYLENSNYISSTLQFQHLNFIHSEKGLNATSKEKKLIKKALKLKTSTLHYKVKRRLSFH